MGEMAKTFLFTMTDTIKSRVMRLLNKKDIKPLGTGDEIFENRSQSHSPSKSSQLSKSSHHRKFNFKNGLLHQADKQSDKQVVKQSLHTDHHNEGFNVGLPTWEGGGDQQTLL